MNALHLIAEVTRAGGAIRANGDRLDLEAPRPLPDDLIERIRQHKAEILAALENEMHQEIIEAAREAAEERAAILEHDGGLSRTKADEVAKLAEAFYAHLWGVGKVSGCCHAPAGRYCEEGRRLRDTYYGACS